MLCSVFKANSELFVKVWWAEIEELEGSVCMDMQAHDINAGWIWKRGECGADDFK